MADCTLVTCSLVPGLDPDDRLLIGELENRGLGVSVETWNDPDVNWSTSALCVLRSTWDYHWRYDEFVAWLERVQALTRIANDPHLVKWNADKSYLRHLQSRGVRIVPTAWVGRGERRSLAELSKSRGWGDVVLKPAKGAAGHGVSLVRGACACVPAAQAKLDALAESHDVLVQPYLGEALRYGERALVFFEGRYSHAIVKKPFDTVLSISDRSTVVEATSDELAAALESLAAVPGQPLYARVDLLRDDDRNVCVSEVELIEPALYLAVHEPARAAFADAIERKLHAIMETIR